MNIFLIRHAEQLKIDGKKKTKQKSQIQNEKAILSIEGEKQASKMSNIEELKNIDSLFCSNYVRAISTAKYICSRNNIKLNIDERLNERKIRFFECIKITWRKNETTIYQRTAN